MDIISKRVFIKLFILTAVLVVGGYLLVYQVCLRDAKQTKKEASEELQKVKSEIGIELGNLKEGLQNGSQLGNSSIDYSKLNSSSLTSNLNGDFVSLQQGTDSSQTGNMSITGNIQTSGTVQGSSVNTESLNVGELNGVLKADQGAVSGGATTSDLAEGSNLYYTPDRFDQRLSVKTTDDLAEGTNNLYYIDSRARNSISGSSSVDYNSATGSISLPDSGVTTGTYGDGTHTGQFTVDAYGRVTSSADVLITGAAPVGAAGGDLTGDYPNPTIKNTWTGVTGITTLGTITTGTWNAGSITSSGAIQGTSLNVGAGAISGGTVNGATISGGNISGGTLSGGNVSGGTLTATAVNGVTTGNILVNTGSYADPSWLTSLAKSKVGLGNVENTALSTWTGTSNINTVGTITTGTWNAGAITSSGAIQGTSAIIPTLYGSSSASGNLTLESTSDATKGYVILQPTSGNVGIGTTIPAVKLDVYGSIRSTSAATNNRYVEMDLDDGTSNSYINFTTGGVTARYLDFRYAGSSKMVLTGTGNVGIGTTSPTSLLHLYGTSAGILNIERSTAANANIQFTNPNYTRYFGMSGTGGFGVSASADIATSYFYINSTGNVGIGTANPGAKLQVSGSATDTIGQIIKAYSGQTADLLQAQDSTGVVLAKIDASGSLTVKSAVFNGTLTVNGHIITGNASGSTTIAVGANAGTGASVSITGNDTSGTITVTTGTGPTAGVLATITFASAYGAAPRVVFTPGTATATGLQYYYGSGTTTFTLNTNNAPVASTVYTYSYHVMQ